MTVRLFAAAKERAGGDAVTVSVPTGATVADVRASLGTLPALRPLASRLLFAVGTDYATDDVPIPPAGEVVAFPPVSGG